MIFSVTLGLVVDDSVHILTKYVKARKLGHSPKQSIHHSFTTCGVALLVTTVALSLGNLSNLFASFLPIIDMGILMASIVASALLLDLFFLPGLLIYYERAYELITGRPMFDIVTATIETEMDDQEKAAEEEEESLQAA